MTEPPPRPWVLPCEPTPREWLDLGPTLGVRPPVLAVLWNRGLRSCEEARRFLDPDPAQLEDPYALSGMAAAVERLRRAARDRERVLVFGDFDVDGLTAAVLATRVLREIGLEVRAMVPNRLEDGFGLSRRAVEEARAFGARLLLSVDCGTSAHEAANRARELGIDVIVADHHMPSGELPPVHALVNPRLPNERYPFPDLAAVGVVYKILQALAARLEGRYGEFLEEQLDLVALGTVADVVPLRGENRVLTHLGLRRLRMGVRPAVRALAERASLELERLEAVDLAFKLAPRLNAPGRLGMPDRSLALLLADGLEEARDRAEEIEEHNRERRARHERVLEEAIRRLEGRTGRGAGHPIVLGSREWHPGVLGIAAARLADRFRVPVVLVSLQGEIARGSARTPPGVDLLHLLGTVADNLLAFGGHRQAVGVSLRPEHFEAFRCDLEARDLAPLLDEHPETVRLDGELQPEEVDLELARQLERLAPFGAGNEEPLFLGRFLCSDVRVEQGRHLRLRAGRGRRSPDCIGFGMGNRRGEIPGGGGRIEVAFLPTINRHRGAERLQLKLKELRLGPPDRVEPAALSADPEER